MKSRIIFLLVFIASSLWSSLLFAQTEICNNGIDDDGDGFVDCYDGSCAGVAECGDFFMGDEASCEAKPTEFPEFKMKQKWGSDKGTAATWSRVSIGDVNGDGIPEVIVTNRETNKMFVLNGNDGSIKQQFNLSYSPEHGVAMADFEGDGYAEFIVSGRDKSIEAYSFDPGLNQFKKIWGANTNSEGGQTKGRPMVLALADFKSTGNTQLYYKNEIRDAKTGLRLVNGLGDWENNVNFAPVAIDILEDSECTDCKGLELVSGGVIYSVNLGNGTKDNGKLTAIKTLPGYYVKESGWTENFSSTSIADYNLDGYLDVIASGATGNNHGPTTVFFWDIKNNVVKKYAPSNNWDKGTGRLNISDIDGNGKLNVTFVSGKKLFALDENFNLLWEKSINEVTSGFTGTTVFDFNGDGAYEIVYRDEKVLYIINGIDGSTYSSVPCKSRTSSEYPVVADVDGDGATEICVVCGFDDSMDEQNGSNTKDGQVRVYKSDGESWVPSRKVWNQHTYFNVNINDNLTIPKQQQKHHLVFSSGECGSGANRPLNTFLNQSPYLDLKGCPTYGAPDFTVLPATLVVKPPTCPDKTFTVSFDVRNDGDIPVSGTVPITFYNGNPKVASGVKLNTVNQTVTNLKPGETISFTDLSVVGPGSNFTLYIAFNDAGTDTPPITLPNGGILECNYDNNIISTAITPDPFPFVVEKLRDNIKCETSAVDNGAATAYVVNGTDTITAGYTFKWYKGTAVKATPDFTGATYTGLPNGTYTVTAVNDAAQCGSTVETVEILNSFEELDVHIVYEKDVTKCTSSDGELSAYVLKNGTQYHEEGGYSFTWYKSSNVLNPDSVVAIGYYASGLAPESYSVVVTDDASGCKSIAAFTVGSNLATPEVTVVIDKEVTQCNQPTGGKLKANVGGTTGNHFFKWYDGENIKITPDHTGVQYPGLGPGKYTVVAVDKVTGCASDPKTVEIGTTVADPTVSITNTINPTSCLGTPNGEVTIAVSTPSPGIEPASGYSIVWYQGTTTSSPQVPGANLSADKKTAKKLAAGDYLVVVTNNNTTCFEQLYFSLADSSALPVVTTTHLDNSICDPALTSPATAYNGSITAAVTYKTNPVGPGQIFFQLVPGHRLHNGCNNNRNGFP